MVIGAIVAGGTGSRMGADIPKQFLKINGKTILSITVSNMVSANALDYIIVGVHPDWVDFCKEEFTAFGEKVQIVPGGHDRTETLLCILQRARELGAGEDTIVISHDAVRPFMRSGLISDHISIMEKESVAGTVLPAVDTILVSKDGRYVDHTPLRKEMYQAQTPQSFRLGVYENLISDLSVEARANVTDVCGVYTNAGYRVAMVLGNQENFKITTPFDLKMAELMA